MAAVNALYDICARPEYINSLRDEAHAALSTDGGSWQLSTIKQLKRLDSFFKESLRFTQPDTRKLFRRCREGEANFDSVGFNRKVLSSVKLSDGVTVLPTGTFINMAAGPMSRDPTFYDEPNTFNGYRFYSPDGGAAQPPAHDFTGIEPGNVAWGSGRLTCPGRWYASAMNKLMVASLLVCYDIQFPEGQSTRPPSIYSDGTIMPSPTQEILFRERPVRAF